MNRITSDHNLKIALLNVSAISTSLDLVMKYIETNNIDIILLTETYHLKGKMFCNWQQFHNYASPHGNARKGFEGLSFLVRPNFPYHIHPLPQQNQFQITIVIGASLTLHGFYLPPSMPYPVYQNLLSAIDFNATSSVICLGDFNTRLGQFVGDSTIKQPRANFFKNWLSTNNVQLWNRMLPEHSWTYNSNLGQSVIDFFISKASIFSENPSLVVEKEINLNSDHNVLHFTFKTVDPIPLLPPPSAEKRRLWKLQRLNEKEIYDLYQSYFFRSSLKIQQELFFFLYHHQEKYSQLYFNDKVTEMERRQHSLDKKLFNNINSIHGFNFSITESPKDFIERIASDLENVIFDSLDISVTPAQPRAKNWKRFWDHNLQQLADSRQYYRKQWQDSKNNPFSSFEDISQAWILYTRSCDDLKKAIKKAKKASWIKFCDDITKLPTNEVLPIMKRIKKSHSTNTSFSHIEGPQQASDTMTDHLREVYGGDQTETESWRTSRIPLYTKLHCPTFFSVEHIKYVLKKNMPARKAPGKDSITKEMLIPIMHPLSKILSLFFTICYSWSWTPLLYRNAMVVPIFKKGDPNLAANYRPISLTTTFRKLFERCLQSELLEKMPALDVAQNGFRHGRGSIDQSLNLVTLQQQFKEQYGVSPALAFLDIKQAYDSVNREVIWKRLRPFLPKPLFFILRNLFHMITIEVIIKNTSSTKPIIPNRCLLQGSILSPYLYACFINELCAYIRMTQLRFPLVVDCAIKKKEDGDTTHISTLPLSTERVHYGANQLSEQDAATTIDTKNVIRQKIAIHCLLYADDVALICHKRDMPLLMKLCEEFSEMFQFRWNPTKSVLINYFSTRRPILLYGILVPIVESFEYLGVPINKDGVDTQALLISHTKKARSVMSWLRRLGCHQYGFGLLISIKLYKIFVRPTMEFALCILGLNATTSMPLDKAQGDCLKMTLNLNITKNAPPMALNIMGGIPSMYLRAQILTFKFRWRLDHQSPFTLLSCIYYTQSKNNNAKVIWNKFRLNKLWKTHLLSPKKTINTICLEAIEQQEEKWCTSKSSSRRAMRSSQSNYDPILYFPCTRLERLRLIKWRLHWLPSFPAHTCTCGDTLVQRDHYLTCTTIAYTKEKISWNLPLDIHLDDPVDDNGKYCTHLLDRLLNTLPARFDKVKDSHWEFTWPLLLQWISIIDYSNHPDGYFEEEPRHGSLFLDKYKRLVSHH